MAYTTSCKTCKKTVSNEAKTCPHCGQPDPACFPAWTLVLTPDGYRPIGEIAVGDRVLSYDRRSGSLSVSHVTRRVDYSPTAIWRIGLADSAKIDTTRDHSFLTTRGWVPTRCLRLGDRLVRSGVNEGAMSGDRRVVDVGPLSRVEPVYNLYTSGEHTFVVHGCVVHNFTHFRAMRTLWHRLFVDPFATSAVYATRA
ncbi:MAG TPA: Hint domain-containing protein [Gemmatimonadaceae bacterium]|nr:Hint domain-containing protein [Gemmatimonadaceae bacterium]